MTGGETIAGGPTDFGTGTPQPTIDPNAGVTRPAGFRAAGVAAGIKSAGDPDLTLIVNDGPGSAAAGVFTQNTMRAAPVQWSEQVLKAGRLRAVVLNSGGANACTGPDGFGDTHATAERAAELLGCGAGEIAVCSTGLIGERLPMPQLLAGLDAATARLATGVAADLAAATAVMTTDKAPKLAALQHPDGWSIGGLAKGCGMIAPNLATMLSVLTTDAVVDAETLDAALRAAAEATYNRLDVDGGTSTNDTVLALSSGASGVSADGESFTAALTVLADDLVRQLQADAEGVTKHVTITVAGAPSEPAALVVARKVACDNLCKTAFFAADPNWGRIAMAIGNAPVEFAPDAVDIALNGVLVCAGGAAAADRHAADLSSQQLDVLIDLHAGSHVAAIRTTDLSHGYVESNSAYST